MEANFFRFLAAELGPKLEGRRIDKIFNPSPDVWTLKIQNSGSPLHVLFRPAKSAGHLFFSPVKPANPQNAPAMAMWFRKRLQGRMLFTPHIDWPGLRIAWELSPRDQEGSGRYLILDCKNGMELVEELDERFDSQPDWPALEDALENSEIWREYPHISPPFRKALRACPPEKTHELYLMVAGSMAKTFFISKKNETFHPPLPWQLTPNDESFDSALDAAAAYGERTLFPLLEMEEKKTDRLLLKRERKKIKRNLARLDEEEARLNRFASEQHKAEALQIELYRFKDEEGLESIEVTHPEHGRMTVPLNPHLSPTENMEKYFKLAAKAQRGFPHIARRRQELNRQMEQLEKGEMPEGRTQYVQAKEQDAPSPLPKRYKGLAVSIFKSSDGFTIIRGKNKKANHDILSRAASTFDYWFHVADGPSSHVILKRDHPGHEVPEKTMQEAAMLCGIKSYRKEDGKADIMYALVKDVRKVKGYAHGQVAVDKRLGTIRVALDSDIEKRLSI